MTIKIGPGRIINRRHGPTYDVDRRVVNPPPGGVRECPTEVSADLARVYGEAGRILPFSAIAAAALARRCVEQLLHNHGIREKDLAKEIETLSATRPLPSHVAETVDCIRVYGTFAAHPIPDNAGAIVDVEPGDAEPPSMS